MRHAPARPKSPARYVIGAGLFCVLTWVAFRVAVWLWTDPAAPLVWIAVLVPATWAGNQWSRKREKEHGSNRRPEPTRR